jgi:hypothetical protein
MAVAKFKVSPGGTSTYRCGLCKKRTRETGLGESSAEACQACYIQANQENMHSDAGHKGDPEDCKKCCKYIAHWVKSTLARNN